MKNEVVILIAEDDEGHANLIKRNLSRAGIHNEILHFRDGQAILDFLFFTDTKPHLQSGVSYLLLLDIRMPKVDGMEVLRRVKLDPELRRIPVIMLSTMDDPVEIKRCHDLGCSNYITKTVDYDKFVEAIRRLGLFLLIVELPTIVEAEGTVDASESETGVADAHERDQ